MVAPLRLLMNLYALLIIRMNDPSAFLLFGDIRESLPNDVPIIVLIFRSVKQVIIKTFVCIAYIDFFHLYKTIGLRHD